MFKYSILSVRTILEIMMFKVVVDEAEPKYSEVGGQGGFKSHWSTPGPMTSSSWHRWVPSAGWK